MSQIVALPESQIQTQQEQLSMLQEDLFRFLDVSEKTLSTYRRAMKQMFKYFAENGVKTAKYLNILSYKKDLEQRNCRPSTIALYLAAARRFFSWTEQRGIYRNICIGVKAPKQERGHKRDYFSVGQIQDIMKVVSSKRDIAIMALLATCGLRTVEVSRANIEDLRTVGGFPVLYIQGKGRNDRTEFVKIADKVEQLIREYLQTRGDVVGNAPLFVSESSRNRNGRLTTRSISGIAKSAIRKAGFNSPRLSAHSLRHSAVTLTLLAGQSLAEVQAFARHSNISTTQIYSHAVDRLNSKCESILSDLIFA